MNDVIEGGVVEEPGLELAVREPAASPTLFGTTDPVAIVEAATRAAQPLAEVVRKQGLQVKIGQSEHVRVEGWTLLGSMLGVFPITVWSRKLTDPEGWEARVEARTRDGDLVGAAEAQCTRDEEAWSWHPKGRNGQTLKARDDYALRSMAQTRATSKALRQPLGFVMQLAGFNPTPAEEMDGSHKPTTGSISEAQGKRLWAIAHGKKVADERVRELMSDIAGVSSTSDVPKDRYDALVAAIEQEDVPF